MAASTRPQQSALRAMGPILSMDQAMVMTPRRLTRPKLGRIPEMPHQLVGQMIEPRVSDPKAKAASAADTMAPEPLEEPQVQSLVFQGLRQGPVREAYGPV